MNDAMVTGRMPSDKKTQGARVLQNNNLTASEAINLLYDKLIQEGSADFLTKDSTPKDVAWQNAARFVDSLSSPQQSRFDTMTKNEIKAERLRKRGLLE